MVMKNVCCGEKRKNIFFPFCRHNVIVTSSIIARPTEKTKNHFAWQDKGSHNVQVTKKNLNFLQLFNFIKFNGDCSHNRY
jgi:hypothetical protein